MRITSSSWRRPRRSSKLRASTRRGGATPSASHTPRPDHHGVGIANEPRGGRLVADEYAPRVRRVARLLKKLDANDLVTVGSEGTGGSGPFRQDFDTDDVDYTALHLA